MAERRGTDRCQTLPEWMYLSEQKIWYMKYLQGSRPGQFGSHVGQEQGGTAVLSGGRTGSARQSAAGCSG